MIGSLLPFFRRSLGVNSRRHRTYLMRELLLAATLLMVVSAHVTRPTPIAPGRWLFSAVAYINAAVICLAGPFYFAGVITEEKENLTLGLLKMTGIRPPSLLLGKAGSEVLTAAALLVAQIPFIVLAVTLGGVATRQIAEGYVALLAHLVFVSNAALLCSVLCRRGSGAARLAAVALLLFFAVPPLGGALIRFGVVQGWLARSGAVSFALGVCDWGVRASIWTRLSRVLATGFAGPPIGFQALSNLLLGGLAFLLAWVVFERATREEVAAGPGRSLFLGRRLGLARLFIGRPWRNALAWKDFYFVAGGTGGLLAWTLGIGLMVAGVLALMHAFGERIGAVDVGGASVSVALLAGAGWLLLLHSAVLSREWRWQTVASVGILPMSAAGVVWRKFLGCLPSMAPFCLWFLFGAVLVWDEFVDALSDMSSEGALWFMLADGLVLAQLALLLSLFLRRGGALVAFAGWLAGTAALTAAMDEVSWLWDEDVLLPAAAVVLFLLAVVLHVAAIRRFGRLAGSA
jgi:hypothetical protein